jgi:HlyD family secretion protein
MIKNSWPAVVLTALFVTACNGARSLQPERFLQGSVEYDERVLGFEIGGRVKSVAVTRGQKLEERQLIATLDNELAKTERELRDADAEAAQAQMKLVEAGNRPAQIRAAEARVRAAHYNEELLRNNFERERQLAAKGASTKAVVDDLAAQLKAAEANRTAIEQELAALREGARAQEIETAGARASAAKKAAELGQEKLAKHELFAPQAGTVLDVHIDPGVVVAAGAPVVTLADTSKPYVDVFLPVAQIGSVQMGAHAQVKIDASDRAYAGHVDWISKTTEFTPRFLFSPRERPNLVVRVRVVIDDPDQRLHAGVPAFAAINGVEARP